MVHVVVLQPCWSSDACGREPETDDLTWRAGILFGHDEKCHMCQCNL